MLELSEQIEAILFWKGEPVAIKRLAEMTGSDVPSVKDALLKLDQQLSGRGVSLVRTDETAMLGSSSQASTLIERLSKDELERDLGKAGIETLSIILYYGPAARRDIDYIRGVNSAFIIRNLMVRGLIDRIQNEKDQRSFLYKPSLMLLAHMGLKKIEDLPEYSTVRTELELFKIDQEKNSENANEEQH